MWHNWVTYSHHLHPYAAQMLDNLCELLPVPMHEDRFLCMAALLQEGVKAGLIGSREELALRTDIAPCM